MRIWPLFLLLGCTAALHAQDRPKTIRAVTWTLDMQHLEPHPLSLPNGFAKPVGCTRDAMVLDEFGSTHSDDESATTSVLQTVAGDGKTVSFPDTAVMDLRDMHGKFDWDTNDREVNLFYYASLASSSHSLNDKPKPGLYLARFDHDGGYLGAEEIVLPHIHAEKVGTFSNGDLLVLGLDEANRLSQLFRYAPIGAKISYYQPDVPFAMKGDFVKQDKTANRTDDERQLVEMTGALRQSQMTHFRDAILILQTAGSNRIYEAFENGDIHSIPLPQLGGLTPAALVPSQNAIWVQYAPTRTSDSKDAPSAPTWLVQVNAQHGYEERRVMLPQIEGLTVACERGNRFDILTHSRDKGWAFSRASIVSARPPAK